MIRKDVGYETLSDTFALPIEEPIGLRFSPNTWPVKSKCTKDMAHPD
jgi:hypothetical protein